MVNHGVYTLMIKVPVYEINESILPARRWNINEEGKWRPENFENDQNSLIFGTNYEIAKEFPLKFELSALKELDYDTNLSSNLCYLYEIILNYIIQFVWF